MDPSQTFAQLYRQHASAVFGLALLLSGNRSDAEDLTSEAFARAFASGGPITQATARSYLYAIVRNLVASMRRRPAVEVAGVDDVEAHAGADPGPEELALLRQRLARTGIGLDGLREPERQVLVLSALHGLSNLEIADALGLQVGNVRVRLHRARQELHSLLQRNDNEPA
jgi:RNA polymerase sigma-70 factor (ECF subfamily)